MRRSLLVFIFLVLTTVCFISHNVRSQESPVKTPSKDHNQKRRIITFSSVVPKGSHDFYLVKRILKEISKRTNYNFKFVFYPPARANFEVNEGHIDGDVIRAGFDKTKTPNVIRVNEPLFSFPVNAYTLDTTITVNGFESLKGRPYTIAHRRGILLLEKNLPKYLKKENISTVTEDIQGFKMLAANRIDIFVCSGSQTTQALLEKEEFRNHNIRVAGVFQAVNIYSHVYKKNQAFAEKMEEILKEMKADGTHWKLLKYTGYGSGFVVD